MVHLPPVPGQHFQSLIDVRARFGDEAIDSLYSGYMLMRDSNALHVITTEQIRSVWPWFLEIAHTELYEQYQRLRQDRTGYAGNMHPHLRGLAYARVYHTVQLTGHLRENEGASRRVRIAFEQKYQALLNQRVFQMMGGAAV